MPDSRNELILKYHDKRESLVRLAFYLFIAFLLIVSLSRARGQAADTPETTKATVLSSAKVVKESSDSKNLPFKIKPPFTEGGVEIDTGDLIVFGPLAILVLVVWFDKSWFNLLKMRQAIQATFNTKESPLTPVEVQLLKEPFHFQPPSVDLSRIERFTPSKVLPSVQWIGEKLSSIIQNVIVGIPPRATYIFAFAGVIGLLTEYVQFRPKNGGHWWHTIIGIPPFRDGFEPHWERFPEVDVAWIYPPWYTLVYVGIVSFLIWRILKHPNSYAESSNGEELKTTLPSE